MTYMLLLNCALKLVEEIILYYDARSEKHKKNKVCKTGLVLQPNVARITIVSVLCVNMVEYMWERRGVHLKFW